MVSSVDITSSAAGAQAYASQYAAVNATATAAAQTTATSSAASTLNVSALPGILNGASTSRMIVDPLAGVITEVLNSQGSIQTETPSTTVIAYLKAGLTAQGYPKINPNTTDSVA